jgi:hypothetical protein
MYKYVGPFALMTYVVKMIHIAFAYSRSLQSNSLNMTDAMGTGSVAAFLKPRCVAIPRQSIVLFEFVYHALVIDFSWRKYVHATRLYSK